MKELFGETFIEQEKLLSAGIKYPIKIEYYKTISTKEDRNNQNYGIQIIKTEYKEEVNIEEEKIEYITTDENKANKILKMFKEYQVTPISAQYIIDDMLKQNI